MQPAPLRPASLVVANPSGHRTRVALSPLPFGIGRHADNQLVLRDNRISRSHARIVCETLSDHSAYVIEDLGSRHGIYVNGVRAQRQPLQNSDRIEFGYPDSYKLTFTLEDAEIHRILDEISDSHRGEARYSNLSKLRSLVEVARALQNSLSTHDVLVAVVDAALAVTGAERGFLLLNSGATLDVSVARDNRGRALAEDDLQVPCSVIQQALQSRRELLAMAFDPKLEHGFHPESTIASLELRSVVCVPLVRLRNSKVPEATVAMGAVADTVGLIYLDSRGGAADLSAGNRELLQTLALEASTILENARLLEEERAKQHIEEELKIARRIQAGLQPAVLPSTGWFRAAGSSMPSAQVGGDYFDVRQISLKTWVVAVADVSGKGVSSALLASFLQGVMLLAPETPQQVAEMMGRINRFLNERTAGEKYATFFFCAIHSDGSMVWANAGHCAPYVVSREGQLKALPPTGMPLGMIDDAVCEVSSVQLAPGDKVVIYTDGITEAQNIEGEFFDAKRLRSLIRSRVGLNAVQLHAAILTELERFTAGSLLADDVTAVVLEYQP